MGLEIHDGLSSYFGKLLDVFYDCLPVPKVRIHFHAFMQQVHQSLKEDIVPDGIPTKAYGPNWYHDCFKT